MIIDLKPSTCLQTSQSRIYGSLASRFCLCCFWYWYESVQSRPAQHETHFPNHLMLALSMHDALNRGFGLTYRAVVTNLI